MVVSNLLNIPFNSGSFFSARSKIEPLLNVYGLTAIFQSNQCTKFIGYIVMFAIAFSTFNKQNIIINWRNIVLEMESPQFLPALLSQSIRRVWGIGGIKG